jgi:hypothetical protein
MSAVANRSSLPRRAVLAGVVTTALVASVSDAKANPEDPEFAAKRQKTTGAWANLNSLYADQERRIKALGPIPKLPDALLEPLILPGKASPTAAHEEGWSAQTLSGIVRTGRYLISETTHTAHGVTIRTAWKTVNVRTRKKAAELLKIREAYDASRAAWWDRAHAIEAESTEPLGEAIDLAFGLMAYPVYTVVEVREKLELIEEFDLINLTDDEAELWGWLIRDALAVAEKAVAHV